MEEAARLDSVTTDAATEKPAASTEKRTTPARLRTLNQLRDEGLITDAEYEDLRRKILSEL